MELVPTAARTLKKALNRYVALTGDTRATMEDPVVRRFCDAYEEAEAGVLARAAAARTKRRVPALRAVPSRA